MEVIVVDTTGSLTVEDLGGVSPGGVRLIPAPGADVAVARAVGAQATRGELVALTEDLCRIPPDWCARLLRARAAGHRAFGGPIVNGSFRAPRDWAAYLLEYSALMPPLASGPTDSLPGMNAAYERTLLEDFPNATLCEPILNGRLRERGVALYLDGELVVRFEQGFGVGQFSRHCFVSGRTFATLRMARAGMVSRAAYAFAAVTVLPLILSARIGARVVARRRARLASLAASPWVALYATAWALGEAGGALTAREGRPTTMPKGSA